MGSVVPFRLIRQKDVAEMLGMTESWVEQVRLRGGGPMFIKIGRSVRYRIEDVEAWLDSQRRCNTSQAA